MAVYLTEELITRAYYLSQILSRDLEGPLTNSQMSDGFNRLNGFIAARGADTKLVPYFTTVNSNFIAGQETYFIPGLTHIETFTWYFPGPSGNKSIRMPMEERTRYDYWEPARAENVNAIPFQYELERVYGGANVSVYFEPQQNFAYKMIGKFVLAPVVLGQDLSLTYDNYYLEYLLHGLSIYLCIYDDVVPSEALKKEYDALTNYLTTLSRIDLTMRKLTGYGGQTGMSYAQANMGRGFTQA